MRASMAISNSTTKVFVLTDSHFHPSITLLAWHWGRRDKHSSLLVCSNDLYQKAYIILSRYLSQFALIQFLWSNSKDCSPGPNVIILYERL
jgi:hypothetical protein